MGLKEFQVLSKLGEGAFSNVWKVKRISDGQEYAMKKVKMSSLSEKEKQNALNEVRILASIKNPYVIGYKEAFFEDNASTLCIVMEYAGGGDIYNKILQHQKSKTFFKEEFIWNYAIQMIIGLKTLHDMKILHRDLKSANIFLSKDEKSIKLGDLNVSKVAKTNLVYTQTGTPYYASPEVWRDQPYDLKSDIWSLGCVVYEMCALKPPFRANDMPGLYKKVQKGVFDRIPSQYSMDLNNFISMCLQVSASNRPNCDKLLNHPILQRHGREFLHNLEEAGDKNELIGTIRFSRNMRALADKLPKPNYSEGTPRSYEFEKGSLKKLVENQRPIYSRQSHRAASQHTPKATEDKVPVRKVPSSRQVRVPSRQKINNSSIENLEERPQPQRQVLQNLQPSSKGSLEKIRPLSQRNENDRASSQNKRVLYGRNIILPSDGLVLKKRPVIDAENRGDTYNIREMKQDIESLNEKIRGISREKIKPLQPDVNYEKLHVPSQNYLINKYLSPGGFSGESIPLYNPRSLDRNIPSRDDQISKRAENIVKKYYADAMLAEKREPLSELRRVSEVPLSSNNRDAIDILRRYDNVYHFREPSQRLSNRRDILNPLDRDYSSHQIENRESYNNDPRNQYQSENNAYGNNINQIRINQLQLRGVTKPSWWG